jgi:predicted dehydrogenase
VVVGYNRRFAPMSRRLAEFLAAGEPLVMSYRVNAGYLPADHWTQDPEQGGGRILGEVCHFVDYLSFLAGAPVRRVTARGTPDGGRYRSDNLAVTLELADGSVGTLTYVASGDPALAKERIEVFGGGSAAILDNFRRLELWRGGRRRVERSRWRQDKGHRDLLAAFVASALGSEEPPIAFADQVMVSRATFAIVRSLRESSTIEV